MRSIVIVAGDRNWDNEIPVELVLKGLQAQCGRKLVIVHGAAPGLDEMADYIAEYLSITRRPFPADWDQFGPAAGPIRNRDMLKWCQTRKGASLELCVGFHNEIMGKTPRGNKRGTRDMLDIASTAGVPTLLVTGWPWQ